MEVTFPQGNWLSLNEQEIEVVLVYRAKKKTSFLLKLLLLDDLKNHYFVNISGTADDSIFTKAICNKEHFPAI